MPDFACRLKQLRIDNKLTQKELADKLNVSQNAIFNWENGKREPSIDTLKEIAGIYGVSLDYLMGFENIENLCGMTTFADEIDDYTQEIGEFLYYNPEHKDLFDASMEVKPQDVKFAKEMLDRINGKTTKQPTDNNQLNAAHAIQDSSEEDKQHDDDF